MLSEKQQSLDSDLSLTVEKKNAFHTRSSRKYTGSEAHVFAHLIKGFISTFKNFFPSYSLAASVCSHQRE